MGNRPTSPMGDSAGVSSPCKYSVMQWIRDKNNSAAFPRNYRALMSPSDPQMLHAFKLASRGSDLESIAVRDIRRAVPVGIFLVVLALVTIPIQVLLVAGIFNGPVFTRVIAGILAALFGRSLLFFWDIFRRDVLSAAPWKTWFRLSAFAEQNGIAFRARISNPGYPGTIFRQGEARRSFNVMRYHRGRSIEIGNFRYVGDIGPRRVPEWGYIAIRLDRKVPNMVMQSKLNQKLFGTRLPVTFTKHQVLPLEGDFGRYFTLYAPMTYERDALYVFTPDLMALLIDETAAFDVEVVDDWMFVYSHKPFDMLSPLTYERADHIVATLGAKTLRQTQRYADYRLNSPAINAIAAPGRRLRTPFSRVFVVGVAVYGAAILCGVLAGIAQALM